jgi:hypothetical protein
VFQSWRHVLVVFYFWFSYLRVCLPAMGLAEAIHGLVWILVVGIAVTTPWLHSYSHLMRGTCRQQWHLFQAEMHRV